MPSYVHMMLFALIWIVIAVTIDSVEITCNKKINQLLEILCIFFINIQIKCNDVRKGNH